MGATVFIVVLAGLALPIILILAAVLVDFLALLWAALWWGYDELAPQAVGYLQRHLVEPVGRYAQAHHLVPRVR